MISTLTVENFKCFSGPHTMPLAPITLVYGPNSGGKSSVIQALLLLAQSVQRGTLSFRGPLVDLGSYRASVWRQDVGLPIGLGVSLGAVLEFDGSVRFWAPDERAADQDVFLRCRLRDASSNREARPVLDECRFVVPNRHDGTPVPLSLQYKPESDEYFYRFAGKATIDWLRGALIAEGLPHTRKDLASWRVKQNGLFPSVIGPLGATKEGLVDYQFEGKEIPSWLAHPDHFPAARQLEWSASAIALTLQGVRYLGPLRVAPARVSRPLDGMVPWVGRTGEDVAGVLAQQGTRESDPGLDARLASFDIPYRVRVRPLKDPALGDSLVLALEDTRTGVEVGLADVGSGVAQVLPIVVQARYGGSQILCVEQPELHLHPRAQAALGDLLAEHAVTFTDGQNLEGNVQWIVETHSETMVLRLQRRIREKRLAPDQVCVLYVDPGEDGSTVQRLRLDDHGDFIDDWPHGFFDESFKELFGD